MIEGQLCTSLEIEEMCTTNCTKVSNRMEDGRGGLYPKSRKRAVRNRLVEEIWNTSEVLGKGSTQFRYWKNSARSKWDKNGAVYNNNRCFRGLFHRIGKADSDQWRYIDETDALRYVVLEWRKWAEERRKVSELIGIEINCQGNQKKLREINRFLNELFSKKKKIKSEKMVINSTVLFVIFYTLTLFVVIIGYGTPG